MLRLSLTDIHLGYVYVILGVDTGFIWFSRVFTYGNVLNVGLWSLYFIVLGGLRRGRWWFFGGP